MNLRKISHYTYHRQPQENLNMILCREVGKGNEKKNDMNALKRPYSERKELHTNSLVHFFK